MKVFITGATGYIGEQLALTLVQRGYEVVALVRSPEKAAALAAAGVRLVKGDLEATEVINSGIQQCVAVFHLAAYARVWPEDAAIFRRVNVAGTRNIMEAAVRNNVRRVIFTSTASVYGPSDAGGAAVTEQTSKTHPYFTAYETSKAEAEVLVKSYTGGNAIEVIILNPARVYGPGRESESNAVSKLVRLYLSGKWRFLPGNGKGIGSYCYLEDVVEACIQALRKGRSGENYLLGGENVSYLQFFGILQHISGKKYQLYKVPYALLFLVSHILVMAARITTARPLITPAWVKKYRYDWKVSSSKAQQELNYTITPLQEGLKKTIEHISNEQQS